MSSLSTTPKSMVVGEKSLMPPPPTASSCRTPQERRKATSCVLSHHLSLSVRSFSPSCADASFDGNQSFPRAKKIRRDRLDRAMDRMDVKQLCSMASGERGISFSDSRCLRHSNVGEGREERQISFNVLGDEIPRPDLGANPNRAFVVVDSATDEILMANRLACALLERTGKELAGQPLHNFVQEVESPEVGLVADEEEKEDGEEKFTRIVSLISAESERPGASLCMTHKQFSEGRRIVMLEEARQLCGKIRVTPGGDIVSLDAGAERVFQCRSEEMEGQGINQLLPQFKTSARQKAFPTTGKSPDGQIFPTSIRIGASSKSDGTYTITVTVYCSLSGLLVLTSDGLIKSCNPAFCSLMFGLRHVDLIGKPLSALISNLFSDIVSQSSLDLSDVKAAEREDEDEEEEDLGCRAISPVGNVSEDKENFFPDGRHVRTPVGAASSSPGGPSVLRSVCVQDSPAPKMSSSLVSSTPFGKGTTTRDDRPEEGTVLPEGRFFGLAKHKSGEECKVFFEIRHFGRDDETGLPIGHTVWIWRDHSDTLKCDATTVSEISACSERTFDKSLGVAIKATATTENVQPHLHHVAPDERNDHLQGPFFDNYGILREIGKGSYGSVYLSFRKSDGKMAVTKFIMKRKVHSWQELAGGLDRIPREIYLLSVLDHPNIIAMLDYSEGPACYALVMEKHGAGMDLFEFVDREPKLDEPLTSYIYRQIVGAVCYLHEMDLLHRDVKDENVVIDNLFRAKLIDFGSAASLPPPSDEEGAAGYFRTFFGTVEYCSPEVLEGRAYRGPELEAWSLGVLLYTLLYAENPFPSIEDTIACRLRPPPHLLTGTLLSWRADALLKGALTKDPMKRLTPLEIASHPWTKQDVDPSLYSFADVVTCTPEEANPKKFWSSHCHSEITS